jgi:hypothetical protein
MQPLDSLLRVDAGWIVFGSVPAKKAPRIPQIPNRFEIIGEICAIRGVLCSFSVGPFS